MGTLATYASINSPIWAGFCFACGNGGDPVDCRREAQDVTAEFLARLPEIRRLLTTDVRAAYEAKVPMGRGCTTRDVMKAIYYLIEQQYETGQALPVTGGQVMLS